MSFSFPSFSWFALFALCCAALVFVLRRIGPRGLMVAWIGVASILFLLDRNRLVSAAMSQPRDPVPPAMYTFVVNFLPIAAAAFLILLCARKGRGPVFQAIIGYLGGVLAFALTALGATSVLYMWMDHINRGS